jgi:hypothetical protein
MVGFQVIFLNFKLYIINLSANTYYPIRIQLGQNTGGSVIVVSVSNPTLTKTNTPSGYFYFFNNNDFQSF